MDRAARAQKLFDKSYFAAAIDERIAHAAEPVPPGRHALGAFFRCFRHFAAMIGKNEFRHDFLLGFTIRHYA